MGVITQWIRRYAPLALCLVLAGLVKAHCAENFMTPSMQSAQRPLIAVNRDARPAGVVTIEIHHAYKKNCFQINDGAQLTLATDSHGEVVLPKLHAGWYYVRARANPNLWNDLCLYISDSATAKDTHRFTLELRTYVLHPYESFIDNAEHSADIQVISEFRGVIVDVVGTPIVNTSIEVVFKGTKGKKYAARLRSDGLGRFSANLAPGDYIALFNSPGFKYLAVPLTVSKTATNGELRVKLKIGDAS
jgi:hypothetical protein